MTCETCGHSNPADCLSCENCHSNFYLAKLRVSFDDGVSETHYLLPRDYTIGRDPDNDIVIEDDSISRLHARIRYDTHGFAIEDMDSKNGSLLNNRILQSARLRNLDYLQLGDVIVHFCDEKPFLHSSSLFATEEVVQKEFLRWTETRSSNVATEDVLTSMLNLAGQLLHANTALLFEVGSNVKLSSKSAASGLEASGKTLSAPSKNMLTRAAKSGRPTIAHKDKSHNGKSGTALVGVKWQQLAIPILPFRTDEDSDFPIFQNEPLGVLYFEQNGEAKPLNRKKTELLTTLTRQIAMALQNEMLYGEAVERRKIKFQLDLAKEIQQKLLPTQLAEIRDFETVSFFHPCEEISGDYFDVIPISQQFAAVAIGDICGKGIPAALLSSTVQATIRSQVQFTRSPEKIITNLNRLLLQSTAESIFLTLFFAILNLKTGEFTYINCGHPPPIFITKDSKITELNGTSPALGIIETQFQQQKSVIFEPRDMLLMYTDGLIESQNRSKKIYGRKRFIELVHTIVTKKKTGKFRLETIVNTIKNDVFKFIGGEKQADDLTFLAIRKR